jgi:c-di-GMP-binding flagellar brake protein YcgR
MIEQRRYERVAFFCPLRLSVLMDGRAMSANSVDISLGGVGLTTTASLQQGENVFVRFQLKDQEGKPVEETALGRVVYARADENGNRIGIEFLEMLTESNQPLLSRKLNRL